MELVNVWLISSSRICSLMRSWASTSRSPGGGHLQPERAVPALWRALAGTLLGAALRERELLPRGRVAAVGVLPLPAVRLSLLLNDFLQPHVLLVVLLVFASGARPRALRVTVPRRRVGFPAGPALLRRPGGAAKPPASSSSSARSSASFASSSARTSASTS